MHILIYSINHSELTGPGKYCTEMCEWLAARGHQVTVVAPPPYYPQWCVQAPHRSWQYRTTVEADVCVRRTPLWLPRIPGGFARVFYALSFVLFSLPVLLWEAILGADVVFVVEPSFLCAPVAWVAARIAGACAWLHVQDFEIDLAYDLGQMHRGRSIAAGIESWITGRFDVVSSISSEMLSRALSKGVSPERLFLLPNWFDSAVLQPMNRPSHFRRQLGIGEDTPVALYSGTLGAKQGVEMILEAARRLRDQPIQFVICGEGVAEHALKREAAAAQNVRFLPLQPAARLNELLNLADVHLLPQRRGTAASLFPSKLIGMLASGRPVVAISELDSEIANFLEGCGICAPHDDIGAFCAAISRLAANRAERIELGREARRRALDYFCKDVALSGLEGALAAQHAIKRAPLVMNDSVRDQG